jgi:hypothetical protein
VHLEVRILAQGVERHEPAPVVQSEPLLGAAIITSPPAGRNQLRQLLDAGASPDGRPQIDSPRGIEA